MILHFTNTGAHSAATSAMFIMEGIMDGQEAGHYSKVLEAWGQGCIELMSECATFAVALGQICDEFSKSDLFDFPGVFDYEVSSPVGAYIANYLIEQRCLPLEDQVIGVIEGLVTDFFTRSPDTTAEQFAECKRILDTVFRSQ